MWECTHGTSFAEAPVPGVQPELRNEPRPTPKGWNGIAGAATPGTAQRTQTHPEGVEWNSRGCNPRNRATNPNPPRRGGMEPGVQPPESRNEPKPTPKGRNGIAGAATPGTAQRTQTHPEGAEWNSRGRHPRSSRCA